MHQFTVTEARAAIACPRILYFDEHRARRARERAKAHGLHKASYKRTTQVWTGDAGAITACGTLFHQTIERFNALAGKSDEIIALLENTTSADNATRKAALVDGIFRFINLRCLNLKIFGNKTAPQNEAFKLAMRRYVSELADVLNYALGEGRPPAELIDEFFGDNRKRVDVTFHVGPLREPVRVKGALDYIFFDYRHGTTRIIDYKLMPPESTSKDGLQASLYALMHHQQHGTKPDAAVMYLHPERNVVQHTWPEIDANRHKIYDLLASMNAWVDYDETTLLGLKPPGEPALCGACPWNRHGQCQSRLGPKTEGERLTHWNDLAAKGAQAEPNVERYPLPPVEPLAENVAPQNPATPTTIASTKPAPASTITAPALGPIAGAPAQPAPTPKPASAMASKLAAESTLRLGETLGSQLPIDIPLASLAMHVGIVGAAGSGKSYLAKVVVEEALRAGTPVLAIDPQGDLVQFLCPAASAGCAAQTAARQSFRNGLETRLWTPGTSHAQRLCLSPLRLPRAEELTVFEDKQRRQEEWEGILAVTAGNLVQLANSNVSQPLAHAFVMQVLRKLLADDSSGSGALTMQTVIDAMSAPEDLGVDADKIIKKPLREKLLQHLSACLVGPKARLFSGGVALDINRFVQPVEEGKTPLNVVYLNALQDDAQKQFFVAALAAEIYRWMITTPSTGKVRLLVFLDEARDFLPAGTSKPPAKEPLLRLFAQGRKFGVSCLICTQSPRSVDYNAFANASTKFIGRLEAAQDVARVGEWFKESSGTPSWLAGRNGAQGNSFLGRWPDMPESLEGQEFRCRPLYSLHEGAWSPDRVEQQWRASPLFNSLASEV